ncbi:MAG: hypothetical protein DRI54_01035 [Bacteroidetes bacterium]|nr:MAG: hypothetical protein DRI54_01035 [Bacteroidota bacterium]
MTKNNSILKVKFTILSLFLILLNSNFVFSQEWKNYKTYKKETGYSILQDGNWLKKDRKKQKEVWQQANLFNLAEINGNLKYQTTSQIRDFYLWFDAERKRQGHEIVGVGVAAIVADQLSKLDNGFIRVFIVGNKEVEKFANEGSEIVFEFAFPLLKEVYFSKKLIKGEEAINWSLINGEIEQCQILEPLYNNLSPKAIKKLSKMAKGKGIYSLGVPKSLRYEGNIEDCQARFEHAIKCFRFISTVRKKGILPDSNNYQDAILLDLFLTFIHCYPDSYREIIDQTHLPTAPFLP